MGVLVEGLSARVTECNADYRDRRDRIRLHAPAWRNRMDNMDDLIERLLKQTSVDREGHATNPDVMEAVDAISRLTAERDCYGEALQQILRSQSLSVAQITAKHALRFEWPPEPAHHFPC